jgi:hypothetical protein
MTYALTCGNKLVQSASATRVRGPTRADARTREGLALAQVGGHTPRSGVIVPKFHPYARLHVPGGMELWNFRGKVTLRSCLCLCPRRVCGPYVQTQGPVDNLWTITHRDRSHVFGRAAYGYGELSHPRACARLHALGHTRKWDETMGRLRSVRIVHVCAWSRASAPMGRSPALGVDIDNRGDCLHLAINVSGLLLRGVEL